MSQKPLNNPVITPVYAPEGDPLDESVQLRTGNHNSLTTDETLEDLTTPEASLSHVELDDEADTTDLTGDDESESTSQSTLSGGTFHTTQLETGDYADSDESQRWQIQATEQGTGTTER
ncbi:MAG: hypothetical protein EON60_06040 [Alphaproteobacteria bacterium]|nr:MAG: hypothetical protein EON60_06040 [Alphaproteobacteria bacterium]